MLVAFGLVRVGDFSRIFGATSLPHLHDRVADDIERRFRVVPVVELGFIFDSFTIEVAEVECP